MRSHDAAATIGISYRQLDYLTRGGPLTGQLDGAGRRMNGGSGTRRMWDPDVVIRLALAFHVSEAMPAAGRISPFHDLASLALDAPPPPRRGYALVAPDPPTLMWASSWADVRNALDEAGAALVVTYDLDDILAGRMDLDDVLGADTHSD